MATVNEELLDLDVRHQIGLQRLSTGLAKKIVALLNRTDGDIVQQLRLRGDTSSFTYVRLENLLAAIRRINKDVFKLISARLRDDLAELAKYEAQFQATLIKKTLPVRLSVVQPADKQLVAAVTARPFQGKLLSEWVEGMEAGRYERLRDGVRMGYVEGETTEQIVKRVAGTAANNYRDGILDISRRGAVSLVRTAVAHTAAVAKSALYAENSDIISAVKWVSVLDRRTSPICRARDGMVFPVDSGPRPPAHIACRSTVVPIVASWKELGIDMEELDAGERASMDGQVPADLTYNQWLRRQSAEVQDEVLGPSRATLFRQGASVDSFVDDAGRQYTLAELRQRGI